MGAAFPASSTTPPTCRAAIFRHDHHRSAPVAAPARPAAAPAAAPVRAAASAVSPACQAVPAAHSAATPARQAAPAAAAATAPARQAAPAAAPATAPACQTDLSLRAKSHMFFQVQRANSNGTHQYKEEHNLQPMFLNPFPAYDIVTR